jgi:ABC-type Zn2+ transport system substrate-binding protein/surface adhesin
MTIPRYLTLSLAGLALWFMGAAMPATTAAGNPVIAKLSDTLVTPAWAHDDEHEGDRKDEAKKDDDEKDDHDKGDHEHHKKDHDEHDD